MSTYAACMHRSMNGACIACKCLSVPTTTTTAYVAYLCRYIRHASVIAWHCRAHVSACCLHHHTCIVRQCGVSACICLCSLHACFCQASHTHSSASSARWCLRHKCDMLIGPHLWCCREAPLHASVCVCPSLFTDCGSTKRTPKP